MTISIRKFLILVARIRKICSNISLNILSKFLIEIVEKSVYLSVDIKKKKKLEWLEIKERLNLKTKFKQIVDFHFKIHKNRNNISSIFLLQKYQ